MFKNKLSGEKSDFPPVIPEASSEEIEETEVEAQETEDLPDLPVVSKKIQYNVLTDASIKKRVNILACWLDCTTGDVIEQAIARLEKDVIK